MNGPSAVTATGRLADGQPDDEQPASDPTELSEELLIEEISIDGMCGVY